MKKIVALVFALALVTISLLIKPAYSLPAYELETTYFSSPFKNVVGTKALYCDGSTYSEGIASGYYKISKYPCNEGRPIRLCYALIDGVETTVPCGSNSEPVRLSNSEPVRLSNSEPVRLKE